MDKLAIEEVEAILANAPAHYCDDEIPEKLARQLASVMRENQLLHQICDTQLQTIDVLTKAAYPNKDSSPPEIGSPLGLACSTKVHAGPIPLTPTQDREQRKMGDNGVPQPPLDQSTKPSDNKENG